LFTYSYIEFKLIVGRISVIQSNKAIPSLPIPPKKEMKLRQVDRTATIAWSPGHHRPFLATGTVAGALDASFSSSTELEIFDLDLAKSKENVDSSSDQFGSIFQNLEKSSQTMKKIGSATGNSR